MSRIRAFIGYRPSAGRAAAVASPPYDVLDSNEARALAEGNPDSFLHVIKPEIDLPPDVDVHSSAVYETGKKNFTRFLTEGVLVPDDAPSLYAYAQGMGDHRQVGLVCCIAVDEYDEGRIHLHERTLPAKEDDRTRHMDALGAHPGPVFLTYRASGGIDALVKQATRTEPDADFVAADGVRHTLWRIADPASIAELIGAFEKAGDAYVADGHHRAKSASRVRALRRERNSRHTGDEEYNWTLAVLFPHDRLQILAYNRIVRDLNGLTEGEFIEKIGERFDVAPASSPVPGAPGRFGLYLGSTWRTLMARGAEVDDPVAALDVSILQDRVLGPILGIDDPRTDPRISFVGGIRGTEELARRVDSGEWAAAFSLYPTSVEQVMAIADAGRIMPPKSTWFEPKLRSGLVVHLF